MISIVTASEKERSPKTGDCCVFRHGGDSWWVWLCGTLCVTFVGSDLEKDRIDGDTPVVRKWDTMGGHGACGVILLESAI